MGMNGDIVRESRLEGRAVFIFISVMQHQSRKLFVSSDEGAILLILTAVSVVHCVKSFQYISFYRIALMA